MSGKSTLRIRRDRAAAFRKAYPKLVKAKQIAKVVCLDERIRHYRLFNAAGASLDFWAGTGTWLIPDTSVRGSGLDEAVSALKDLTPAPKPERERAYSDLPLVTIFTDASFDYKTSAAGWAGWVKSGPGGGAYDSGPTSAASVLEAESNALANGIQFAIRTGQLEKGGAVLLQSDCMNALGHILTLLPGSQDKPATGGMSVGRIRNLKKIRSIDYIVETAKKMDLKVMVRHVKGHSGRDDARSFVNSECDRLARAAMRTEQRARRDAAHV